MPVVSLGFVLHRRVLISWIRGLFVCLFFNSFIEIEFTYCKICLFKLYNSMVFNILTELYDHHSIQLMDIFNPQRNWPVFFLKLTFAQLSPTFLHQHGVNGRDEKSECGNMFKSLIIT